MAVALAVSIPALAGAQGRTFAPNSMALAHSVVVIGPNSPAFDALLERWFPGVTQVNYFAQLKPLLAIVHNNTKRQVKAYVVKWTITNADGSTSTATLPVMWEPGPDEARLAGTLTVLGPAGTGEGTQLVSPFFHWLKKGFQGILLGGVQAAFVVDARYEPLVATATNAKSIRATLDGVIFGDGVFVGPDTSLLYERFQAAQQAAIDEAAWMSNLLQTDATAEEVKAQLSRQIYDGRNSTATDSASLYKAARGREAARLLGDLDRRGAQYGRLVATELAVAKPTAVRKQTTQ
ncbi:MAG: hypothetical protein ACRD3D_02135 [Terriglobia bacterium]